MELETTTLRPLAQLNLTVDADPSTTRPPGVRMRTERTARRALEPVRLRDRLMTGV